MLRFFPRHLSEAINHESDVRDRERQENGRVFAKNQQKKNNIGRHGKGGGAGWHLQRWVVGWGFYHNK